MATANADKIKRYAEIETIKEEFDKQHVTLVGLLATVEDPNLVEDETIRENFEHKYFAVRTIYTTIFDGVATTPTPQRPSGVNLQDNHIKLPKIELIKFNGDIKLFPTFIDMFNALVHSNQALSSIEKFNYLIASLSGPPLSLVTCIPMTQENYLTAYSSLTARYSNKRLLAAAYWSEIENSSKLTSENSHALRQLLDVFSENLSALKTLEFPIDQWDFILVHMLLKRLDSATVTRFEMHHGSLEVPAYSDLITFLNKHCIALDTLSFGSLTHKPKKYEAYVKENHVLYKCPDFANKTPAQRYQFAKECSFVHQLPKQHAHNKKLQFIIIMSTFLLHFDKPNAVGNPIEDTQQAGEGLSVASTSQSLNTLTGFLPKNTTVLLSTALIEILDGNGTFQKVRALIDSGSQTSFITQKCVNRLRLSRYPLTLSVQGLGQQETSTNSGGVTLELRPRAQVSPVLTVAMVVMPKICNELPTSYLLGEWSHTKNLQLADPYFNKPGAIEVLLGADVFAQILLNGRITGNADEPIALNTIFGKTKGPSVPSVLSMFCSSTVSLDDTLKKILGIGECSSRRLYLSR
ncbi:hypothetical protein NQ317_007937 [Molorchus minor]|uniref:Peptidase A2 domain-containing protein n=1 Tax=Molorchus minor TaxID=1323400 RepID=A0ABQ9JRI4_9CUCU|nr:hypothetical protein NQ317_007937 [Molorchus minor]